MEKEEKRTSFALRMLVRAVLNVLLVWLLATYMSGYFQLTGGWPAIIVVGLLLMVLNVILRPILEILTMPLKWFATILAVIVVNGVFVQVIYQIAQNMDTGLLTLEIGGGILGWAIVAIVLGVGNWLMKMVMR